jgi:F-type H+-transporting ATPase subunit gamma
MKEIKRRIKSVESTMQITKAMQLVASSKLRRAKERAENIIPFFNGLYDTMCEIVAETDEFDTVYTRKTDGRTRAVLIVIAGDRGLAGGFNSNVMKLAAARYRELGDAYILPVGKKAVEYFEKRDFKMMDGFAGIAETIDIYQSRKVTGKVTDAFKSGKINRVEIIYTAYVSPITQQTKNVSVLPVENFKEVPKVSTNYEPTPEAVFEQLIPWYVAGMFYCAVTDSYAAECAARRMAMENATDNAAEIIDELSLMYNRARQSSITQEITEIVGGANAL